MNIFTSLSTRHKQSSLSFTKNQECCWWHGSGGGGSEANTWEAAVTHVPLVFNFYCWVLKRQQLLFPQTASNFRAVQVHPAPSCRHPHQAEANWRPPSSGVDTGSQSLTDGTAPQRWEMPVHKSLQKLEGLRGLWWSVEGCLKQET